MCVLLWSKCISVSFFRASYERFLHDCKNTFEKTTVMYFLFPSMFFECAAEQWSRTVHDWYSSDDLPVYDFSIVMQVIIENPASWLVRKLRHDTRYSPTGECNSEGAETKWRWSLKMLYLGIFKTLCSLLFSNNHLHDYTKTIMRLRLSEYYGIIPSTLSRRLFNNINFALGEQLSINAQWFIQAFNKTLLFVRKATAGIFVWSAWTYPSELP